MGEKTNYKWLPWAIAASIAIGLVVISGYSYSWTGIHWLTPWLSVEGAETVRAINEFSNGSPNMNSFWDARFGTLFGLIFIFVIGPSFWIYSEVRNQSRDKADTNGDLRKGIGWYVGVVAVIWGLIYALPITAIKAHVFQNTVESSEKHRSADQLKAGLIQLGYDALEKYYLPHGKGGGAESFKIASADGSVRPLALSDLRSYSKELPNSYVVGSIHADSLMTIYGISHHEGSSVDFQNKNGQQGKIQVKLEIMTPVEFDFVESNLD